MLPLVVYVCKRHVLLSRTVEPPKLAAAWGVLVPCFALLRTSSIHYNTSVLRTRLPKVFVFMAKVFLCLLFCFNSVIFGKCTSQRVGHNYTLPAPPPLRKERFPEIAVAVVSATFRTLHLLESHCLEYEWVYLLWSGVVRWQGMRSVCFT